MPDKAVFDRTAPSQHFADKISSYAAQPLAEQFLRTVPDKTYDFAPKGEFTILDAYLRVNNNSEDARSQARRWLAPLVDHMDDACLGSISEIFEADEPHRPVGCCAQAWSVAEVLRLAVALGM